MDQKFNPTLYNGCKLLPSQGLTLIDVSKKGLYYRYDTQLADDKFLSDENIWHYTV